MNGRLAIVLSLALALACQTGSMQVGSDARVPPDPDTSGFYRTVAEKIDEARQAVIEDPASADKWGTLGMVFQTHKLVTEAFECYGAARRLDPTEFRWPYLAATIGGGDLNPEQKLELLKRARSINPHYPPLNVRLANLLFKQDRVDESGRFYELALRADPDNPHALLGLGRVALSKNDAEGARTYLEEALWEDRELTEVWASLVRVYNRLDLPDLASRAAARASEYRGNTEIDDPILQEVSRQSARPKALYSRARKLSRRGRLDEAIALLHAVLEVQPDNTAARVYLGRTLILAWRDEEGIAQLKRANEIAPGAVDIEKRLDEWRDDRYFADRPNGD